jgi:hypothetical protein
VSGEVSGLPVGAYRLWAYSGRLPLRLSVVAVGYLFPMHLQFVTRRYQPVSKSEPRAPSISKASRRSYCGPRYTEMRASTRTTEHVRKSCSKPCSDKAVAEIAS